MNKTTKLTLEDFIAKAENKYTNRKKSIDIYLESFEGEITFNRPADNELLKYLNDVAKAIKIDKLGNVLEQNMQIMLEAAKELVFNACEYLHSSELQKSLEVVDPTDITLKVFGIEKTMEIAEEIADVFMDKDIQKKIKN